MSPDLDIKPPQRFLEQHVQIRAIWCAQKDTNLQILEQHSLKSFMELRLDSVRKNGVRNLPFLSEAAHPQFLNWLP